MDHRCKKSKQAKNNSYLFSIPKDIINIIISYCPCPQWFILCKEFSSLASRVISPLDHRRKERGALCWAIKHNKILAVISLLKDPRIDPSINDNKAIRYACDYGQKEIVEILLQDHRVDPSTKHNEAIQWACEHGHKEIVEMLLKDKRVDPSDDNNFCILEASSKGYKVSPYRLRLYCILYCRFHRNTIAASFNLVWKTNAHKGNRGDASQRFSRGSRC
jgi:hypothetical protein